jgi:hypothetical protein
MNKIYTKLSIIAGMGAFFSLLLLIGSCSKDPIENEVVFFEGEYRVDSIRQVKPNSNTLFTGNETIILKERPLTDTIEAFGEITIVEPAFSENTLMFSQSLYQFNFVKKFVPNQAVCVDVSYGKYVAYWFPDLNKKRLTFWSSCGNGSFRAVLTVRELSDNRFELAYVEADPLGTSGSTSALKLKELIYITKK